MNRVLDVASSIAATLARGGVGAQVGRLGPRPEKTLQLFEFEGCPYCRKVREALSILDLEADVFPCPKYGPSFREEVKRRGGKYQFPFLVDPNTDVEMYESDAIVAYLFERYGDGPVPRALGLGALTDVSAQLASLMRAGRGVFYRGAKVPERPLELWSFEASPFCRIVREKLCELELPYRLHNVAKGSPGREAFERLSGKMMVPFLVDPNTGKAMFESADIVAYLDATYGAPNP
jgi:glutathione S-transferase